MSTLLAACLLLTVAAVWLGVLGLIQVFRLALQRGQRAEDELEGVI